MDLIVEGHSENYCTQKAHLLIRFLYLRNRVYGIVVLRGTRKISALRGFLYLESSCTQRYFGDS